MSATAEGDAILYSEFQRITTLTDVGIPNYLFPRAEEDRVILWGPQVLSIQHSYFSARHNGPWALASVHSHEPFVVRIGGNVFHNSETDGECMRYPLFPFMAPWHTIKIECTTHAVATCIMACVNLPNTTSCLRTFYVTPRHLHKYMTYDNGMMSWEMDFVWANVMGERMKLMLENVTSIQKRKAKRLKQLFY